MNQFYTAESVTEGHPDKLCDLIADSVLDECLSHDALSRVACEVMATRGQIIVAGEITSLYEPSIPSIVRSVLRKVGYNPARFAIQCLIHKQSPDIAAGVDCSLEQRRNVDGSSPSLQLGAGDQGIMVGYACSETPQMLPLPVVLAHRLTSALTIARKSGAIQGLRPDGKAQVTVEYDEDGKPFRLDTVVLSAQHSPEIPADELCFEAPNVNLVALYGPEHGVRGDVHAGDHVTDIKDATTGLPVYSLYGKTRKATPDMLKDVDVLVYDIQDIGCRSFTYISTMGLAMEAAAENGKEFIVLDRPNPVGGLKIEGNLVEDDCISFVSQFKIPYLYALTCGELALMLNGEKMLKDGEQCNLHVVKMKGWKRKMDYTQTGLQWVPSSPHIPHPYSAFFYPVSGILGELGYMSIGVGYTIPFQMFAAPWMEAEKLAGNLNRLNVPGVIFRPMYLKPFYSVGKGELLQGVQVHIMDFGKAPLSDLQFLVMQEVAALYPDRAVFDHADKGRFNMFDKVSGSRQIRERFSKRNRWEDIRDYWHKDAEDFRKLSKKYYLYK